MEVHRSPTADTMVRLIGLMQKEFHPSWEILDCWQNSRENVVLLNAPLIHSGFLPCVAWMNPSNTIAGVWTAPGLRRQGFASALLSLLEPELKFVQKRSRTLEFIQRTHGARIVFGVRWYGNM